MAHTIKNPSLSLESKARQLAQDATHVSFWGGFTLDTNRVFVSKSAADKSSGILKAGIALRAKPGDK